MHMKKILASLLFALAALQTAWAAGGGIPWDRFPTEKLTDRAALQNGARLFSNYCLNCHAAGYMRYNRLQDIGLSDEQIKTHLLFAGDKVGETMQVALNAQDAKQWFGATPPDLTLVARSRAGQQGSGADYLYTFLRTYYRDPSKATGWNNLAFPSVGMPHVLWELQGQRRAVYADEKDANDASKSVHVFKGFEPITAGSLDARNYDVAVADLVAYLTWMAEPMAKDRIRLGVGVLIFLALFTLVAWRLNAAYWRDVK
jgi:ubiquinol-cytochrome c reductase cytochrome c1 subunit